MSKIAKFNYNQFFEQPDIIRPSMNYHNAKKHYDNSLTILAFSLIVIGITYYMLTEEKESIKITLDDHDSI